MSDSLLDAEHDELMSPLPRSAYKAELLVSASAITDPNMVKCPRCWHYHGVIVNYDMLCDRCCSSIVEGWPDHESVPFIKANLASQRRSFARVTSNVERNINKLQGTSVVGPMPPLPPLKEGQVRKPTVAMQLQAMVEAEFAGDPEFQLQYVCREVYATGYETINICFLHHDPTILPPPPKAMPRKKQPPIASLRKYVGNDIVFTQTVMGEA